MVVVTLLWHTKIPSRMKPLSLLSIELQPFKANWEVDFEEGHLLGQGATEFDAFRQKN